MESTRPITVLKKGTGTSRRREVPRKIDTRSEPVPFFNRLLCCFSEFADHKVRQFLDDDTIDQVRQERGLEPKPLPLVENARHGPSPANIAFTLRTLAASCTLPQFARLFDPYFPTGKIGDSPNRRLCEWTGTIETTRRHIVRNSRVQIIVRAKGRSPSRRSLHAK